MRLKRKPDFDAYFKFLEELFALFPPNVKRKLIIGNQFKL
jgi:hypothetical protein